MFFTNEFVRTAALGVERCSFFDTVVRHAFPVSLAQQQQVEATLQLLHLKKASPPACQAEILQHVVQVLLYETEAIYAQYHQVAAASQTRAQ